MTVVWACTAGSMPARSPHINYSIESFRKLKFAFATPLPRHSRSNGALQRTCFAGTGNGCPVTTIAAAGSPRLDGYGGREKEKDRRVHFLGPVDGGDEAKLGDNAGSKHNDASSRHSELKPSWRRSRPGKAGVGKTESKHYGSNSRNSELKPSWTRSWPAKMDIDSIRPTRPISLPGHNLDPRNFRSRRAAFGTNAGPRNNGGGGKLGNDGSSIRNLGFRGDEEMVLIREQRRAAFENWATEKLKTAGNTALQAIEEMRQAFAPGSPKVGPECVSRATQQGNVVSVESNQYRQTGSRSSYISSPISQLRKSGMSPSANGGYGRTRVDRRGSSSSPTSRFGGGRSEQQLVARSSSRAKSLSPRSSGGTTWGDSRSASTVASESGVHFPYEGSGQTSGEKSSSGPDPRPTPQPLLVKRSTKFPVNFHGRGGTVMLVDKPQGWTSFAVCAKLRYVLKIQKVGHSGTLDPMATGLLIICLGKATKLADSFQAMKKVYSGTFRLGESTPSLDADTEVSDVLPWEHITDDQLEQAKQEFVGDIFQKPPMYSAVKVDGERLYVKARKGELLEVPPRLVTVIDFQLERSPESRQDIHFKVTCSKGTYIRSLCADLARAVGSYAHLIALRREKIGTHRVQDAWPILEFVEQYSQTRETAANRGTT